MNEKKRGKAPRDMALEEILKQARPVEAARTAMAERLGENPDEIKVIRNDLITELMSQGIIVDLDIGRWRAETRISPEDLGLTMNNEEYQKFFDDMVILGRKLLLPRYYVKLARSREELARRTLKEHSYKTRWGAFVPYTAYAKWKAENEQRRQDYLAVSQMIWQNWDSILKEMRIQYAVAATEAYKRLREAGVQMEAREDEFIQNYVDRIISAIPSVEEIIRSFRYEVNLFYVPLRGMEEVERISNERLEVEQEKLTAEREALDKRRQMLDEMNQEVVKKYREEKQRMLGDFLEGVVSELSSLVYDATVDVLESIQQHGRIVGPKVTLLRNMIEKVEALNFYDDEDLRQGTEKLKALIGDAKSGVSANANLDEAQNRLKELAIVTRSRLLELRQNPRSARRVGVDDVIDEATLRKTRESLRAPKKEEAKQIDILDGPRKVRRLQTEEVAARI